MPTTMAVARIPLILLVLPALNLLAGHVGPLAPTTCRALAVSLVLFAWITLAASGGLALRPRWIPRLGAAILAAASLVAILYAPDRDAWMAGLAVNLALLTALVDPRCPELGRTAAALTATATANVVLFVALQRIPWLWNGTQSATVTVSTWLGHLLGTGVTQAASTGGVPTYVSLLVFAVARTLAVRAHPWPVLLAAGFWLTLLFAAQLAAGPILAYYLARSVGGLFASRSGIDPTTGLETAMAAAYSPVLLLTAGVLLLALIEPLWSLRADVPTHGAEPTARKSHRAARGTTGLAAAVLAAIGFACLVAPIYQVVAPARARPRVLFLRDVRDTLRQFNSPDFERFGFVSAGMFGEWLKHLSSWGYDPVMMDPQHSIDAVLLAEADVFVIINPDRYLPPEAQAAIWSFVDSGGALLVLGDHTDIQGTMGPLNELLAPVGIRFRFDSAFTPTRWVNAYETFPHPITAGLDSVNDRLRQSTGASLDIDPAATPLVSAKWGFSDWGDRTRTDHAFLGDYAYQFNERLGDVVVIATAPYGRGQVVVFGDTSAFQTHAMPHAATFGERLFAHLTSERRVNAWLPAAGLAALGLASILSLLLAFGGRVSLAASLVAMPALLVTVARPHVVPPRDMPPPTGRVAYLDAAHANRFTLGPWDDASLDGLLINLARNGYLPRVLHAADFDRLNSGKLFVTVAPARPFAPNELDALTTFMQDGGLLVLSVGYEEKAASAELLALAGMDIDGTPLGPVPIEPPVRNASQVSTFMESPHFKEAWPLVSTADEPFESLYTVGTYDIVGFRALGRGGALVIADSRFLHDKTLETEKAWWKGNIDLIRSILEKLRSRGVGV